MRYLLIRLVLYLSFQYLSDYCNLSQNNKEKKQQVNGIELKVAITVLRHFLGLALPFCVASLLKCCVRNP